MNFEAKFTGLEYKKYGCFPVKGKLIMHVPTLFGFNFAGISSKEDLRKQLAEELMDKHNIGLQEVTFRSV